ncbi:mitochondrial carrier protein [Trypanosoma theileri]|uniref:Mitochondrial carrier protein n=1 Tax=Trypanosoma theileri TaxID=67003 RepID=A0A1X0P6Z0_9TRYP|nr:mitochondrial carrier protein [Trypanosoma theileri]ORC92694.1 mitochondrial carrier protein [Trypanosoma theileri]
MIASTATTTENISYAALSTGEGSTTTPSSTFSTNAVSRSLSDMHVPTWFGLLSMNIVFRTMLFHPLNLVISRKRVTKEGHPPSVMSLARQAYRGEAATGTGPTTKGIRALYRGFGAAIIGNLIGEVTYLHTMESVREYLESSSPNSQKKDSSEGPNFNVNSFAVSSGGVMGELAAVLLVTPIVVVCNRQMTSGYGMTAGNTYRSAWGTAREVFGLYQQPTGSWLQTVRRGFRGLYSGLLPGIAGLPASGMWWALYSESKSMLYTLTQPTLARWEQARVKNNQGQREAVWKQNFFLSPTDNPAINALAGMIASGATAVVFNPVDVLHTRLQALPPSKTPAAEAVPFGRIRQITGDLIRTEGWRGFFKGTVASTSVAVLNGIVFSLFFELTKLGSDREFLNQL